MYLYYRQTDIERESRKTVGDVDRKEERITNRLLVQSDGLRVRAGMVLGPSSQRRGGCGRLLSFPWLSFALFSADPYRDRAIWRLYGPSRS